ncbi:hypothetical protein WMF31_35015 [Sorangium sp. So ce1036]|uniref:hypothetical protein n=1 Tax=Sorangium sp. So ce1036 TaxID=3133328 RepID=UPI003F07DDC7
MKARARTCSALVFLSLAALSACGGPGDGPGGSNVIYGACEEVAACGGDPTGSWTLDGVCVDPSLSAAHLEDCDAKSDASGVEVSGTIDFHADGTFVRTMTAKGRSRSIYPPGCSFLESGALTCEGLNDLLKRSVDRVDSDYESAGCAVVGESCVCDMVMSETTETETGTWAVSGATLTIARDGRDPRGEAFCAQGSSLTLGLSARLQADDVTASAMSSYMRFTRR